MGLDGTRGDGEHQTKDLVGFNTPWRFESSLRHQHSMPWRSIQGSPVPSRRGSPRRLSSVFGWWQGSAPSCTEWNPHAPIGRGSGHPEGTPGTPRSCIGNRPVVRRQSRPKVGARDRLDTTEGISQLSGCHYQCDNLTGATDSRVPYFGGPIVTAGDDLGAVMIKRHVPHEAVVAGEGEQFFTGGNVPYLPMRRAAQRAALLIVLRPAVEVSYSAVLAHVGHRTTST